MINFGKKRLEKFCSRQNSAAENIEERNLRIENLEIKVWIQNFRIKNKKKKVAKISRPTFNECIREQSNHVRVLHKYTQVKNLDIKFLLLSRYFFYGQNSFSPSQVLKVNGFDSWGTGTRRFYS